MQLWSIGLRTRRMECRTDGCFARETMAGLVCPTSPGGLSTTPCASMRRRVFSTDRYWPVRRRLDLLLRTDHMFQRGARLRRETAMGHEDDSNHRTYLFVGELRACTAHQSR